ncbi:MAG: nicotinate-nucleotide adenylyltransferase [Gammaproteobacteria bacterium]|jgi:nicotinate-nucleotide adenylyltransferase
MIGILGGTFDPVHFGHLRPALEIRNALELEEMRLVPCRVPPHRTAPAASPEQRVAMLRLAIGSHPVFRVDERELQRGGPSYTLDTLKSLRQELSGKTLCLLVGGDAFRGLDSWHRWDELTDHCHMVVMTRPGYGPPDEGRLAGFIRRRRVADARALAAQDTGLLLFRDVTQLEISATRIRNLLAAGGDAAFLLPEGVLDFIHREGLYKTGNAYDG